MNFQQLGPLHACTHGLWMPNEASFHRNPKLLGLGRQFGHINFGTFGLFSANLSATIFGTVSPLRMFSINQPLFLQKLSLYIQSSNSYLGLVFEFQRKELGI